MTDQDELVPVGKITGTHGVRGVLKVYSYSGNIQSLQAANSVQLKSKSNVFTTHSIKSVAAHSGGFLLGLDGVTDMTQAQTLSGAELYLLRSQLPLPGEDEYYWRDLIGLTVYTDTDQELGTIADIFETGSSDIYVVRNGDREYLIPAIADVIASVDLPAKKMIITPLEGLLDL